MQETQVRSLVRGNLLEEEIATHFSILVSRTPWTEEPGGLWSMGSQRVRHDFATWQAHTQIIPKVFIKFATILLLFYVLVFWLQGTWGFSFLTRDPSIVT